MSVESQHSTSNFKEPFLHIYIKHIKTWNGLALNRIPLALKTSRPGAAAHMSLHLSNNVKEPTNHPIPKIALRVID
jgi:hypothetical protein